MDSAKKQYRKIFFIVSDVMLFLSSNSLFVSTSSRELVASFLSEL